MSTIEASMTGTLRIIAILFLIWVVLRVVRSRIGGDKTRRARMVRPDQRPKGDIRIEPAPGKKNEDRGPVGPVSDADYEEVK